VSLLASFGAVGGSDDRTGAAQLLSGRRRDSDGACHRTRQLVAVAVSRASRVLFTPSCGHNLCGQLPALLLGFLLSRSWMPSFTRYLMTADPQTDPERLSAFPGHQHGRVPLSRGWSVTGWLVMLRRKRYDEHARVQTAFGVVDDQKIYCHSGPRRSPRPGRPGDRPSQPLSPTRPSSSGTSRPDWGTSDRRDWSASAEQEHETAVRTQPRPDGRWIAELPPLGRGAGGGHTTLTVRARIAFSSKDVLVIGEVWICSGQSNMEWR